MTGKLKSVFVGTGRDGSVSIADMVADLFMQEGAGRGVMHEYMAREFLHLFSEFRETGDARYRDEARALICDCSYDCIVGVGSAVWLPEFAEICGPGLKLVQIRRRDRERCIDSLVENCRLFPFAYRYYLDSPSATTKRPAAFHFGEMTRDQWEALPPARQAGVVL